MAKRKSIGAQIVEQYGWKVSDDNAQEVFNRFRENLPERVQEKHRFGLYISGVHPINGATMSALVYKMYFGDQMPLPAGVMQK